MHFHKSDEFTIEVEATLKIMDSTERRKTAEFIVFQEKIIDGLRENFNSLRQVFFELIKKANSESEKQPEKQHNSCCSMCKKKGKPKKECPICGTNKVVKFSADEYMCVDCNATFAGA